MIYDAHIEAVSLFLLILVSVRLKDIFAIINKSVVSSRFLKVDTESEDKTSAGKLLKIVDAPTGNTRFPHSVCVRGTFRV